MFGLGSENHLYSNGGTFGQGGGGGGGGVGGGGGRVTDSVVVGPAVETGGQP